MRELTPPKRAYFEERRNEEERGEPVRVRTVAEIMEEAGF